MIVSTPGICGGKPRIDGRRITVQHLAIRHHDCGESIEQLCDDYMLSVEQVEEALAYYQQHKAEIDERIARDEAYIAEMRSKHPIPERLVRAREKALEELASLSQDMGLGY